MYKKCIKKCKKYPKNIQNKFKKSPKNYTKKCKNLSFFVHFCKNFKDFLKTFLKVGIHNFTHNN